MKLVEMGGKARWRLEGMLRVFRLKGDFGGRRRWAVGVGGWNGVGKFVLLTVWRACGGAWEYILSSIACFLAQVAPAT
jgi:hypothetical protein